MELKAWDVNAFGPLVTGQSSHGCAINGDYLYTFGGKIEGYPYSGIIQKCEIGGSCNIIQTTVANLKNIRAVTINEHVK